MTDTSVPADDTAAEEAEFAQFLAWRKSQAEAAAAGPTEEAEAPAVVPVTEHPAYGAASELLSFLHLAPAENTLRNVFEWVERHVHELAAALPVIEKAAPVVEEAAQAL